MSSPSQVLDALQVTGRNVGLTLGVMGDIPTGFKQEVLWSDLQCKQVPVDTGWKSNCKVAAYTDRPVGQLLHSLAREDNSMN